MKAIIFDCDGTLADTMPLHYEAWRDTLARYGIEFTEERFYAMGGMATRHIVEILAAEAGLDLDAAAVSHEKEMEYVGRLDRVKPHPLVEPIVRKYRGVMPMAVATGSERWLAEKTLNALGVLDWFDAVVCTDDVPRGKPDPAMFLEAARRMGVAPEECLVYEDADPGLEAARRAGMECVDVRTLQP